MDFWRYRDLKEEMKKGFYDLECLSEDLEDYLKELIVSQNAVNCAVDMLQDSTSSISKNIKELVGKGTKIDCAALPEMRKENEQITYWMENYYTEIKAYVLMIREITNALADTYTDFVEKIYEYKDLELDILRANTEKRKKEEI